MAKCLECGKEFSCAIVEEKKDCWCFHKPKIQPSGFDCLCEECLMKKDT